MGRCDCAQSKIDCSIQVSLHRRRTAQGFRWSHRRDKDTSAGLWSQKSDWLVRGLGNGLEKIELAEQFIRRFRFIRSIASAFANLFEQFAPSEFFSVCRHDLDSTKSSHAGAGTE